MFLLYPQSIKIDWQSLSSLEEKKKKLFRYLVYEKKYNNLKLFRTYLKGLLRLQDVMNSKSAQFEASSRLEAEIYTSNLAKGLDYIADEVIQNHCINSSKDVIYLHYLVDPENHAKCNATYRKSLVQLGKLNAPEPHRISSLMDNMFYNAGEISNTIIKSIYLHHEIVRIHPFSDGNGRVARLSENWVLMHDLYPPIVISSPKDRQIYIRELENSFLALEQNPEEIGEATTKFFNGQIKRLNNSLDYLYTRLKM
ncbi:MAG TPA: Fic family protein [Candidatus Cloacimonadota bacterium]|nr:Fic family protein [Candidatus Cloacimonadota bacterium]HPK40076.1 Fic family protein [Candidatus Cloacimonadota bacterium]HPY97327.1 Fic family protein [Candidatus Cloacimonadota bacterium]HQB41209.1 Fic family protein [Candidatus Cloacimonadota bacterium]